MVAIGAPSGSGISSEVVTDPGTSYQSADPIDDVQIWGAAVTLTWDVGPFGIKSITAYRELDQKVANDYDASRFVYFDQLLTTDQDQTSQELQFFGEALDDRLNWLVGAFYFTETSDQNNAIAQGGTPFRLDYDSAVIQNQRFTNDTDSTAAFTQLTYALTEQWSVTGGVRFTHEKKSTDYNFTNDNRAGTAVYVKDGFLGPNAAFAWPSLLGDVVPLATSRLGFPFLPCSSCSGVLIDPVPAPAFTCVAPGIIPINLPDISESWDSTTGRVAVDYQATEDLLLYLSWSSGFKSGGVNSRPINASGVVPFDPEEVDQYELGMKSQWFEDRVRFNVASYYSDYQDIQQLVADPTRFFIIQNIGDADLWGVETELLMVPIDALRFDVRATWAKTDIQKLTPEAMANGLQVGDELANRPDWLVSLGAQYTFGLGSLGDLTLRTDYYYQGDSYADAQNLVKQDGYDLVNLRATYAPTEQWSVAAYGRNITDELIPAGEQNVVSSFGTHFGWYGPPREWGLEASYRF